MSPVHANPGESFVSIGEESYEIGFMDKGFSWDNEHKPHKVYLKAYKISFNLVTNPEYLQFIKRGGYRNLRDWHSDGRVWMKEYKAKAPLYWHLIDGSC